MAAKGHFFSVLLSVFVEPIACLVLGPWGGGTEGSSKLRPC